LFKLAGSIVFVLGRRNEPLNEVAVLKIERNTENWRRCRLSFSELVLDGR
jgi:hypothetical protein